MNKRFYRKPKHITRDQETLMFEKVVSLIPRSTMGRLRELSEERGVAMSRLVCIALDNELDAERPFNYPTPMPETLYIENAYALEAGRVLELVRKMGGPTTIESLLLSRREVEVLDRRLFMHGLRELIESQMVEYYAPRTLRHGQDEGFKLIRATEEPGARVEHSKRLRTPPGASKESED